MSGSRRDLGAPPARGWCPQFSAGSVTLANVTSASGIGIATITADGTVLDTWFPAPELSADAAAGPVPAELEALVGTDEDRGVRTEVVRTTIASLDDKPADAHDAYLRLHLLSHRLVAPHGANMDGIFGLLTNVVWTNFGPCAVEGFETVRALRAATALPVAETDDVAATERSVVRIGASRRTMCNWLTASSLPERAFGSIPVPSIICAAWARSSFQFTKPPFVGQMPSIRFSAASATLFAAHTRISS